MLFQISLRICSCEASAGTLLWQYQSLELAASACLAQWRCVGS